MNGETRLHPASQGGAAGLSPPFGSARAAVLVAVVLGTAYMAAFLVAFLVTGDRQLLLISAAMGPVLILLAPQLFFTHCDLLSPLNFIALSALFGTSLRTLYVVYSDNPASRNLLLDGQPPEFLLPAVLLINAAVICLIAGFLAPLPRVPLQRLPLVGRKFWSRRKLRLWSAILLALGLACLVLYVHRLGIRFESLAALSAKRRVRIPGAYYNYAALGYYLWGMSLVSYAFFLRWTDLAFSRRRLHSLAGVSVLAIGLLAVIPPFLTSSRTGFLTVPVYALIIWHYGRRPVPLRWLAGAVVAGLLVISVMGGLRALGKAPGPDDITATAAVVPETVLGNRNWLGVTKTAHLMAAVPEQVEYQRGRSFLTWLVAPIPRTLWPEKPIIRVGITVGEEVFDKNARSGVPPGFVAELYLNFGYPGVLVGMFILGLVLRLLVTSFLPLIRTHRSALLIYTVMVFPLSFTLVTTDFSGTVLDLGRSLITLGVLLPLITMGARRSGRMHGAVAAVGPDLEERRAT